MASTSGLPVERKRAQQGLALEKEAGIRGLSYCLESTLSQRIASGMYHRDGALIMTSLLKAVHHSICHAHYPAHNP